MRGYYSDKVEVSWQGLDFGEGLAMGSFITPAQTTPSFSQKAQLKGKVIRSFNADRSGTLTILVNQSSKLQQQLIQKANDDRLNRNVVGPLVIKDIASGRQTTYQNAYIQTNPDEPFAAEDSDISWVFGYESVDKTVPLDNANVVGN